MTEIDIDNLEVRVRRAYERGRWRLGALSAWPALLLAGVCITLGGQPSITILTGALLAGVIVLAVHHGRAAARAVMPGLAAGSLPLLAGLAACRVPHACGGAACMEFCAPLCVAAGAIAGLFLAVRARRSDTSRSSSIFVGGCIAMLTGALGCVLVGVGGVVGMALGLSAGAAVGLSPRAKTS